MKIMKMVTNFDEFEGEIIKYSDYLSEQLNESLGQNDNKVPQKSWTLEDSQQLSTQLVGVKHPWTRDQYEKFAHPDVKRDITYETYIDMWNMRAPEDQRVIIERSGSGFNVDKFPSKNEKSKVSKNWDRLGYGTSGFYGTSGLTNSQKSTSSVSPVWKHRQSSPSNIPPKYWDPVVPKTEPKIKDSSDTSLWSKIKLETRIMIIIMIIGLILSLLTVVILMLK